MMSFMEPDATTPELGHRSGPVHDQGAPVRPVRPALPPTETGAADTVTTFACTSDSPAGARETGAPVHADTRTSAEPVHHTPDTGAPTGARLVHRVSGALRTGWRPAKRTSAPVHQEAAPAPAPVHTPPPPTVAPVAPVRTVSAPPPAPRKRPVRPTPTTNATLGQQWGKLTEERSAGMAWGLRILAGLIVISLVGVVVAPPALSAHDIIAWAQSKSVDSGLGLSKGWAWVTFLALDFAAGVCVLICVYCAIVNVKPGVFALYVWAFAGATAYANWSFGDRPGAPGDAIWFFPTMSIVGPLLLHSVLVFLRKRIKGAQGNKRGQRPSFPLVDWLPVFGTPQDTYGAWRTGAMLGIEVPDLALWTYRAISMNTNWVTRWFVKPLVRKAQIDAFRARLADPTVALSIPGLLPDGAFSALVQADDTTDDTAPGAPVREVAPAGAPIGATATVHGASGAPGAPAPVAAPTGAPAALPPATDAAPVAPVHQVAPGAPVRTGAPQGGASGEATVVNLDDAARHSAVTALTKIAERFADTTKHTGWADLIADRNVSLSKIERELSIGKRRAGKAFEVADQVLPWADVIRLRADAENVG